MDVAVSAVYCERRQKKGTNSIGDQFMHTCRDVDRVDKDVFVRVPAQVQDGGDINSKPAVVHCIGEVVRWGRRTIEDEQMLGTDSNQIVDVCHQTCCDFERSDGFVEGEIVAACPNDEQSVVVVTLDIVRLVIVQIEIYLLTNAGH